jgi:hypothetical protein
LTRAGPSNILGNSCPQCLNPLCGF